MTVIFRDNSYIGCFRNSSLFTSQENENHPELVVDYKSRDNPIGQCALLTQRLGFRLFGLRNEGECLTDENLLNTFFLRYNGNSVCAANSEGTGWSNFIDTYTLFPEDVDTWTPWSTWTSCSVACDGLINNNTIRRFRYCMGSTECEGAPGEKYDIEEELCNTHPCPWDGDINDPGVTIYRWLGCWSMYSSLANEIFTPIEELNTTVFIKIPTHRSAPVQKCAYESYGNAMFGLLGSYGCFASANYTEAYLGLPMGICGTAGHTQAMNVYIFTTEPESVVLNGHWTVYDPYTSCDAACDGGEQSKTRYCANPIPDPGGVNCTGDDVEVAQCNTEACPQDFVYKKLGCWNSPNISSLEGEHILLDPIEGRKAHVSKCGLAAYYKGYKVFGLMDNGMCYADSTAQCRFDFHDSVVDCGDLGTTNGMAVYTLDTTVPDDALSFHFPECVTEGDDALTLSLSYLQNKASLSLHESTYVLDSLSDIIDNLEHTSAVNLLNSLSILDGIALKIHIKPQDTIDEYVRLFTMVTSKLMEDDKKDAWLETSSQNSKILDSVENFGIGVGNQLLVGEVQSAITENLVIQTSTIEKPDSEVTLIFPNSMDTEDFSSVEFTQSTVYIPSSVFESEQYTDAENITVTTANYRNLGELLPLNILKEANASSDSEVNSVVTSVKLKPPLVSSYDDIIIVLSHLIFASHDNPDVQCVFWDFNVSSETNGAWSAEGCQVESTNRTHTVCACNHLTSFGVLMRVSDMELSDKDQFALSIITYVCCAISILALIIAFSMFIYLDNLSLERTTIHKNLIIAIAMAQIIYLAGINSTSNQMACTVVAVLLHFFYTAAFTWMLNEGLHLYSKVVEVFSNSSKLVYYYVIGWGIPVLIVGISVAVRYDGYGSDKFCWLSLEDGLIWAFVGPVITVILINFIVMVLVIKIIMTSASAIAAQTGKEKTGHIKAGIKGMMILLPILGVTWLFGLFAISEHLVFMEYLFAIFNSLQGLFIFVFHCLGNSEVRSALKRKKNQRTLTKDFSTVTSNPKSLTIDTKSSKLSDSGSSQVQIILTRPESKNEDIVLNDFSSDDKNDVPDFKITENINATEYKNTGNQKDGDGYFDSAMDWNAQNERGSHILNRPFRVAPLSLDRDQVKLVDNEFSKLDDPLILSCHGSPSTTSILTEVEMPTTPHDTHLPPIANRNNLYHRPANT